MSGSTSRAIDLATGTHRTRQVRLEVARAGADDRDGHPRGHLASLRGLDRLLPRVPARVVNSAHCSACSKRWWYAGVSGSPSSQRTR